MDLDYMTGGGGLLAPRLRRIGASVNKPWGDDCLSYISFTDQATATRVSCREIGCPSGASCCPSLGQWECSTSRCDIPEWSSDSQGDVKSTAKNYIQRQRRRQNEEQKGEQVVIKLSIGGTYYAGNFVWAFSWKLCLYCLEMNVKVSKSKVYWCFV